MQNCGLTGGNEDQFGGKITQKRVYIKSNALVWIFFRPQDCILFGQIFYFLFLNSMDIQFDMDS